MTLDWFINGFEFWGCIEPEPASAVDEHTRPVVWLVSIRAHSYKTKPGKCPSGRGYHIKTCNFKEYKFYTNRKSEKGNSRTPIYYACCALMARSEVRIVSTGKTTERISMKFSTADLNLCRR